LIPFYALISTGQNQEKLLFLEIRLLLVVCQSTLKNRTAE